MPETRKLQQRLDRQGVPLVRTGMENSVVLADIGFAIEHHAMTFDELAAVVDEQRALTVDTPSLRDTLAFYADPATYRSPSTGFAAQYDPEPAPITRDAGAKARAALVGSRSDLEAPKESDA